MTKRPNKVTAPRATPHARLGSTFGFSAINLQVTPSFGPGQQLRFSRSPWTAPSLLSYPVISSDALGLGRGLYIGIQEIGIGKPALTVLP
jgi:hypothetical protein